MDRQGLWKIMNREDVNQFRRKDMTVQELEGFSKQLGAEKAKLDGIISEMKTARLKDVYVDGAKKIPSAIEILQHGLRNVKKAMLIAREGL